MGACVSAALFRRARHVLRVRHRMLRTETLPSTRIELVVSSGQPGIHQLPNAYRCSIDSLSRACCAAWFAAPPIHEEVLGVSEPLVLVAVAMSDVCKVVPIRVELCDHLRQVVREICQCIQIRQSWDDHVSGRIFSSSEQQRYQLEVYRYPAAGDATANHTESRCSAWS